MSTVRKQVEITVNLPNDPASMGQLMATAGSCGAEVLAACSYYSYDGAVVMLVVASRPVVPGIVWTLFFVGVLIFSGSLYLLAATNLRWLGAITPIGGLCLLAGWLLLAIRPM